MVDLKEIFESDESLQKRFAGNKLEVKNLISEESFRTMISVERKRTERSGKPFMVMTLDVSFCLEKSNLEAIDRAAKLLFFNKVSNALVDVTRDIDIRGWLETGKTIGILFTEVSMDGKAKIIEKIKTCFIEQLEPEHASRIGISALWYPQDYSDGKGNGNIEIFYPDPSKIKLKSKIYRAAKRSVDVTGSLFGLFLFSPVFIVVPVLIKLSSKGPVLFRQERVGKGGKSFKIYKFRTMKVNNDESAHREYVTKLIKGQAEAVTDDTTGTKVYKIVKDPRITSIGQFLRKTSLDELPQFINVLLGNMSLVGPRPPIPYEVAEYHLWHKRRVLETKPGITGYWQVEGRSTTNFEGMVRMDLQYIRKKSFWLDIKVILKTPLALFTSKGAY